MSLDERNITIEAGHEGGDEPFDVVVPEKNLLRAVLMSALNDLKRDGDVGRKATEFFLNQDEDYIFSFRTICDFLSVDPKRILRFAGLTKGPGNQRDVVSPTEVHEDS